MVNTEFRAVKTKNVTGSLSVPAFLLIFTGTWSQIVGNPRGNGICLSSLEQPEDDDGFMVVIVGYIKI